MYTFLIIAIIITISSPEKPKATSALDFFGSSPVERASRNTYAKKRKQVC